MQLFTESEHHALANQPLFTEVGGFLFLTLKQNNRTAIATTIERLINVLDELDGDPDYEFQISRDERELDECDDEPTLGSVNDYHGKADQTRWASGAHFLDECEEENEHGGDINDEPHDWDEKEPFMGSGETCGQGPKLNGQSVDPRVQCLDDVSDSNDCDAGFGTDRRVHNALDFDQSGYIAARNALRKVNRQPLLRSKSEPYAERATRLSDGTVFRTFVVPQGFTPNRVQNYRDADRCFEVAPGVVRVGH